MIFPRCTCGQLLTTDQWVAVNGDGQLVRITGLTCIKSGCPGNIKQRHEGMIKPEVLADFKKEL